MSDKNPKKTEKTDSTSNDVTNNVYKTKKKRVFFKIVAAYLAVYLGICLGYAAFGPRNHEYRQFNFTKYTSSIIMQPVMELIADGKVSYWYDWDNIDPSQIDKSIPAARLYSQNDQYRDYKKNLTFKNFLGDMGKVKESAVVEPKNYNGQWSLVFCTKDESVCKKSNLVANGKIRILIDGDMLVWGMNAENKLIPLNVVEYTNRNNYKEYPLI